MEQLNKANACDTTSGSMSPRVTTTDASLEGSTVSSSVPDYALCSEVNWLLFLLFESW